MEGMRKVLLTVGILVLLVAVFYFISSSITKYTGFFVSSDVLNKPSDFEVCLGEQDIALYINTEDVAKSLGKIKTVDFLEHVEIMNCIRNNQRCLEDGVSEFPAWIINSKKIGRDVSIYELADFSGCKLI